MIDGSVHVVSGAGFVKLGDKVYQKQGQNVTWSWACADIQNKTS